MDYIEKFKNRVKGYLYASTKYDKVLENENLTAVRLLNPMKNEKILHIAAVGVNIKKYIDPVLGIDLVEVDQNEDFVKMGGEDYKYIDLNNMPYMDNTFDKAIVIANFHHSSESERRIIYKEIFRVLKPNGVFILGDVIKNSQQDKFLNVFVNEYNPCGHQGLFFDWSDLRLFNEVGFKTSIKKEKYKWIFESKEVLIDFCYNFFHLEKIEKSKIYDEIKKYLTIVNGSESGNNNNCKLEWDWELIYFISKVSK